MSTNITEITPFVFDPDWSKDVRVSYQFETVVARSKRFVEQRRPLRDMPLREIELQFWDDGNALQRIYNTIKRGLYQAYTVPIASEPARPTVSGSLQGYVAIPVEESLTEEWNTVNASQAILIDHAAGIGEVADIAIVADQLLTLTGGLAEDLQAEDTTIYPAIDAVLETVPQRTITDSVTTIALNFKEIIYT